MKNVGLWDSTFPGVPSATLGGENRGEKPTLMKWCREEFNDVIFFTDIRLHEAKKYAVLDCKKIAWLVEPRGFSKTAYEVAELLYDQFDYIVTHEVELLDKPKYIYCPLGGSWIKDWGLFPKEYYVSMITTTKRRTEGHLLRWELLNQITRENFKIPTFGKNNGDIAFSSKSAPLRSYMYSIVVESCLTNGYFSEKLIDCLSQGTMPIYIGAPDISKYFDINGFVIPKKKSGVSLFGFNDYDLEFTKDEQWLYDNYHANIHAIMHNLGAAEQYRCVEDYMFKNLPEVFLA